MNINYAHLHNYTLVLENNNSKEIITDVRDRIEKLLNDHYDNSMGDRGIAFDKMEELLGKFNAKIKFLEEEMKLGCE